MPLFGYLCCSLRVHPILQLQQPLMKVSDRDEDCHICHLHGCRFSGRGG